MPSPCRHRSFLRRRPAARSSPAFRCPAAGAPFNLPRRRRAATRLGPRRHATVPSLCLRRCSDARRSACHHHAVTMPGHAGGLDTRPHQLPVRYHTGAARPGASSSGGIGQVTARRLRTPSRAPPILPSIRVDMGSVRDAVVSALGRRGRRQPAFLALGQTHPPGNLGSPPRRTYAQFKKLRICGYNARKMRSRSGCRARRRPGVEPHG